MRFAILLVIFAAVFVLGRPLDDLAHTGASHNIEAAEQFRLPSIVKKVAGHVKNLAKKVTGFIKGKKVAAQVTAPLAEAGLGAAVDAATETAPEAPAEEPPA